LKLVLFYTLITRLIVTGGGIRREDLNGVRTRAKVRHPRRGVLHSWGFSQLRQMIAYKAVLAGVLVELVDPHNTSRTCSKCGHCEKGNRGNQSTLPRISGRAAVKRPNVTWSRIVCRIRFASGGFQPSSQAPPLGEGCKSNKKARWAPEGSPQRASFPVSFAWNQNTARRL